MPIFDEAAAVEAPKEGSPEYLIMVCQQHMAWLTVYAEGMTQADWRDMQDRLVSQIGLLKTDFAALAALKPFMGGLVSKSDVLQAVPTNWLDDLLTGPKAVLPKSGEYRGPDIERLLTAIRARIEALPASPDR